MTVGAGDTPPRRLRRKLLVAAAATVAALLACELGLRTWRGARGEPYRAASVRAELERVLAAVAEELPRSGEEEDGDAETPGGRAGFRLHPYLGYDLERGTRQIEGELERRDDGGEERYSVLILGGSVAANFAQAGTPRLKELLLADPRFADRELTTRNYGRPAFKQPQQLALVGYLLGLGLEPDLIVNVDGFNELAVAASNARFGAHPSHPSYGQWRSVATAPDTGADALELLGELLAARAALLGAVEDLRGCPLLASALFGEIALRRLHGLEKRYADSLVAYSSRAPDPGADSVLRGPRPPADPAAVLEASVRQWVEGSRSLHALCAARGIEYLHVLQPTLHDPGAKPLTPGEIARGTARPEWIESVRAGYPLLRAAGEELAAEGVRFLDASRVFAGIEDELYFDACHFDARGNRLLAEAIAAELLSSGKR